MKGQWKGEFNGTNSGTITLDADELSDCYDGYVYMKENDPNLPDYMVSFRTPDKSNLFDINNLSIQAARDGERMSIAKLHEQFPQVIVPPQADTNWEINSQVIRIVWKTNLGTSGTAELLRNDGGEISVMIPEPIYSWNQFKDYVASLEENRFIFRGQENNEWRLRTHFHRTGRANLYRFIREDRSLLYKNLSHLTSRVFDLDRPEQNGAFISLAQHHGYPTPLLDWTYSPFIAAYFSCNDLKMGAIGPDRQIRLHVFDRILWEADFNPVQSLNYHLPNFSVLEALALDNPRMIPQQALATLSNVADIESHILKCEKEKGKRYLRVIDLPSSERDEIVKDLRMMGITAGSLFPGLDGTCRQLKELMFGLY